MNFGHFPNKNEYVKTKNRKTKTGIYNEQFPDRGTNEVYILFFNLNGRKNKKQVRQTSSWQDKSQCSKMCKLPKGKHHFQHLYAITNKHDVSETLSPLLVAYSV